MEQSILWTIPTDPDYYGSYAEEEYIQAMIDKITELLYQRGKAQFPKAEIEVKTVPELLSHNNTGYIILGDEYITDGDVTWRKQTEGEKFFEQTEALYNQAWEDASELLNNQFCPEEKC